MMQFTTLEGISAKLSRLVFGTPSAVCSTPEEAYDCLEMAYAKGFRVFDTAHAYGSSEENIGYWLKRSGHRNDIVLFDKGFNPNQHYDPDHVDAYDPQTIYDQIAMSLERLGTDHVDFYVLHRDDPTMPFEPILDALNACHAKGMMLRFGASNWTWDRVKAANAYAAANNMEGFTALSPCYSTAVFERDPWGGSVTISGEQNRTLRAEIASAKLPVFPYSSLARGYMSGRFRTYDPRPIEEQLPYGPIAEYDSPRNRETLRKIEALAKEKNCAISTVTLAWLLDQELDIFPIIAPGSEKHIDDALKVFEIPFTREELVSIQAY